MSRKSEIFESVLTSAYDNNAFVGFVQELLNNVELVAPNAYKKVYNNFSYYVDGYYHIGNYTGNDGGKIAIFSVALKKGDSVERARTMQRNFVKPLLENGMCAGALVAFYTPEEPEKWRLSFIRLDYEFSKGKVTEKLTPARRYSYLVGKGEPCNTAKQRLFPIFRDDDNNPDIDELEEAFSVEKVTNEFFQQYCEKYHELREYLEANTEFMQEAEIRHFTSEQFAKKLLGQIVFLYFIQKKGWLGVDAIPVVMTEKDYKNAFFARGQKSRDIVGSVYAQQQDGTYRIVFDKLKQLSDEDEEFLAGIIKGKPWGTGPKDFMRKIFEGCKSAGKNYFDDYLEPLFYTGLNVNRGENGFFPPLHRRIPFLNGGLFEQLDNYEWENNNFNIPNSIFSNAEEKGRDADGILDIFDRYNFTMNEDEPMEREVAIDPEMLGKVFENLLDVKDRKSKGAFYTPREIVHYMCQETLINHLVSKTGITEEAIRDFVLYGEYLRDEDTIKTLKVTDASGKTHYEIDKEKEMLISEEIFSFKKGVNRLKELDDLLANVKVADLAVGSGAFPLGMLNEIVKARQVLTEYLAIEMNGFQKKSFYAYERKPYDLKVNTIKNCIFACDIEPSAVDIAKLRLWLSIVIDDEITDNAGNGDFDAHSKPRQLPNLDCNIICGNSLIDEFKGNKLITESVLLNNVSVNSQQTMFQSGVDVMLKKLIELQDKLFFTKEHNDKEEIKAEIQHIYDEIILEQLGDNVDLKEAYYEAMNEASKPFVLWQLYFPKVFKENGGFDIVIGNPPYVKVQSLSHEFIDVLKKRWTTAWKRIDMSTLFMELGWSIINASGTVNYITSNQFLTTEYGRKMREFIVENRAFDKVIDFGDLPVFENAMTYVSIFFLKKKGNESIQYNRIKELPFIAPNEFEEIKFDTLNGESWNLGSLEVDEILNKVKNAGKQLSEIAKPSYGLVTGKDDVLMFDMEEELDVEEDVILPVIRAQGCDRYGKAFPSKKVLYPYAYKDYATVLYEISELEEKYPKAYKYIMNHSEILKERKDSRNKFGDRAGWYGLVRFGQIETFNKPKIVTPGEVKHNKFCIDYTRSGFTGARVFAITIEDDKVDIKYLLALLNSKVVEFFMHHTASLKAGGYYSYSTSVLEKIPIIIVENQTEYIELVDAIMTKREQGIDTKDLENEIEKKVYQLYGILEDEISIIEKDLED